MKFAAIILSCLTLSACATTGAQLDKEMIPVVKYVVKIPPAELLTPPPPVTPINPDTAKQSDVARWIIDNEVRTQQLEQLLIGIAQFFKNEQEKSLSVESRENDAARAAAAAQQLQRVPSQPSR